MKDEPAILGGSPVFDDTVVITKPTLPGADELIEQIETVLSSGMITTSKFVRNFEEKVSEYIDVKHAVAVNSCTSGLILILKALGVEGEVLIPSFTFYATAHAVRWNGLKPVFVDCDRGTYNIDPEEVEKAIGPKTSAIIGVHLFGNPCAIDRLEQIATKHNLRLIFDSAHGFGSRFHGSSVGGSGDAESFSLSPTKLITAGEGGMVTTNDDELAKKLKIARNYGDGGTYDCELLGLNARMPEISAILGISCLEKLEENVKHRNRLAERYKQNLSGIAGLSFQEIENGNRSSCKDFTVLINADEFGMDRDILSEALSKENISTRKYFYPPVHQQKLYTKYYDGRNSLAVTEEISSNVLSLPLYSHLEDNIVDRVCEAIEGIHEFSEEISDSKVF